MIASQLKGIIIPVGLGACGYLAHRFVQSGREEPPRVGCQYEHNFRKTSTTLLKQNWLDYVIVEDDSNAYKYEGLTVRLLFERENVKLKRLFLLHEDIIPEVRERFIGVNLENVIDMSKDDLAKDLAQLYLRDIRAFIANVLIKSDNDVLEMSHAHLRELIGLKKEKQRLLAVLIVIIGFCLSLVMSC